MASRCVPALWRRRLPRGVVGAVAAPDARRASGAAATPPSPASPSLQSSPLSSPPLLPSPPSPPPTVNELHPTVNELPESRLNPRPDDYAAPSFADRAELSVSGGGGGNGCVSFLRDAYLPDGPPNGGDGGVGGSVYVQAAHGETSLHKLARRRSVGAARGAHGQGGARGGARGHDVVITVPVGTVVRELERRDPVADDALRLRAWRDWRRQKRARDRAERDLDGADGDPAADRGPHAAARDDGGADEVEVEDPQLAKWLLYPGMSKSDARAAVFPRLPRRARYVHQPAAPIHLDLSRPTPRPILVAAGGLGGLGNPHFASREHPRPVFATRGEGAVSMRLELELKLLADVGLVGLPNAGKSTLLRALTNSRARVGAWAFTTLQPNIGTVVLDRYAGRPVVAPRPRPRPAADPDPPAPEEPRTRFTVADIPGLIEGAHLDRGLGIAFLRHVERAGVLAFVVDLAAGNAVAALDALWREVGLYAQMRDHEDRRRQLDARVDWGLGPDPHAAPVVDLAHPDPTDHHAAAAPLPHIAAKPWFVVATKADLADTQPNFAELKAYLDDVTSGKAPHPSHVDGAWTAQCAAIPVSAINGQGVDRIVHWTVGLLDG